jgi:drug/metabolite transporter (DMT)-like permease
VLVLLMLSCGIGTVLFETQVMPGLYQMFLISLSALFLVAGHSLLFMACRIGPARSVAPFMYTLTVWAVLSSVILFNEIPNALAIAGMALVVVSGLLVLLLDTRRRAAT